VLSYGSTTSNIASKPGYLSSYRRGDLFNIAKGQGLDRNFLRPNDALEFRLPQMLPSSTSHSVKVRSTSAVWRPWTSFHPCGLLVAGWWPALRNPASRCPHLSRLGPRALATAIAEDSASDVYCRKRQTATGRGNAPTTVLTIQASNKQQCPGSELKVSLSQTGE
jgi:hypothetical protein